MKKEFSVVIEYRKLIPPQIYYKLVRFPNKDAAHAAFCTSWEDVRIALGY